MDYMQPFSYLPQKGEFVSRIWNSVTYNAVHLTYIHPLAFHINTLVDYYLGKQTPPYWRPKMESLRQGPKTWPCIKYRKLTGLIHTGISYTRGLAGGMMSAVSVGISLYSNDLIVYKIRAWQLLLLNAECVCVSVCIVSGRLCLFWRLGFAVKPWHEVIWHRQGYDDLTLLSLSVPPQ